MAKGNYRVTDEKINLIFRLYPITKSQRAIAKAVDLSQGTVNKILNARMIEQNKRKEEESTGLFNVDSYFKSLVTI